MTCRCVAIFYDSPLAGEIKSSAALAKGCPCNQWVQDLKLRAEHARISLDVQCRRSTGRDKEDIQTVLEAGEIYYFYPVTSTKSPSLQNRLCRFIEASFRLGKLNGIKVEFLDDQSIKRIDYYDLLPLAIARKHQLIPDSQYKYISE